MSGLTAGTILGDRYEITGHLADSAFGTVYRAVDREASRVVAVRAIRNDLLADKTAPGRLYAEVKKAGKLDHKNIVRSAGLVTGDGVVGLVTQRVVGKTLREMMTERGQPFSLKTTYNVIAHLANALDYAHHLTMHGGITATDILVNRAGRIKLAGFGLTTTFPQALHDVSEGERATLAPEMLAGPPTGDTRSDIYALGALLFELLTCQPLIAGVQVTELAEGLPAEAAEIDQLIARMVGPPANRPDSTRVKATLAGILDKLPRSDTSGQFRVEASRPPEGKPPAIPRRPEKPTEPPRAPAPAARAEEREPTDPGVPRWIIRKGKLDFGPYTMAQVKEQVATDEALPDHVLVDNDTGERIPIERHPALGELSVQAAHRRNDARRAHVEATVVKQDKRRGAALYAFLGVGAVVLCGAVYLGWRVLGAGGETRQKEETTLLAGADLAGLKVGSSRSFDPQKDPHRKGPGGPRVPGAKNDGFDDSQSMDMNAEGAGDERLDNSQIDGVLGKHAGALGRCLSDEVNRGGSHNADIELVILGSGKVSAVRVNGETGTPLASCMRGVMNSMQFPTFNGARTRASFPMSL